MHMYIINAVGDLLEYLINVALLQLDLQISFLLRKIHIYKEKMFVLK